MIKDNFLQREANQLGYFDQSEESELFAKQLVSAISKGNDRISLTLTEKGVIAFARELSNRLLAERAEQHVSNSNDDDKTLLSKQQVMEILSVSSTTLWLWEQKQDLIPVKIGRKIFYRAMDIQKLRGGIPYEQTENSI